MPSGRVGVEPYCRDNPHSPFPSTPNYLFNLPLRLPVWCRTLLRGKTLSPPHSGTQPNFELLCRTLLGGGLITEGCGYACITYARIIHACIDACVHAYACYVRMHAYTMHIISACMYYMHAYTMHLSTHVCIICICV